MDNLAIDSNNQKIPKQDIIVQINIKLEQIVKIFTELKNRVDDVESRQDYIEKQHDLLDGKAADIESQIENLELDEQLAAVDNIREELEYLKDTLRNL